MNKCQNNDLVCVKKEVLDIQWAWSFGITYKGAIENKTEALRICARRAYRDVSRTLKYSISADKLDKMMKQTVDKERKSSENYERDRKEAAEYTKSKSCFIKKVIDEICNFINKELLEKTEILLKEDDASLQGNFDKLHEEECEKIIDIAKNAKTKGGENLFQGNGALFYIGQAQKWLNMTFKYMLAMGLWDDSLEKIRKHLHIPVDDYIIEAVKRKTNLKIGEDFKSGWSKWEEYHDKYFKLQQHVRKTALNNITPMDWETAAWIEVKKRRDDEADKKKKDLWEEYKL